ncbi:MAG: hypothetical protein JWL59_579 [Chthoniobacteraceae bacterium]|nr:hypothetical protein [Chthoniobacteraceae bacterium]
MRIPLCRFLQIGLLFLSFEGVLISSLEAQQPAATVERKAAPELFSRIVLLGASATAGFDMSQPLGGPKALEYRFSNFVEAALAGTHEPVITQASALLFLDAQNTLEQKITATVASKPTLVIGLDALFWFCYGSGLSSEQRLSRLESGLQQLERIEGPLVLGDIPDASGAVGGILSREEMPERSVLEQCNERLKKWAAGRKNVVVFPLASLMAVATSNEELILPYGKWDKGKSTVLLRSDKLHPSRHGLAALAVGVLDAAGSLATPRLPESSIVRDLDLVYATGAVQAPAIVSPVRLPE